MMLRQRCVVVSRVLLSAGCRHTAALVSKDVTRQSRLHSSCVGPVLGVRRLWWLRQMQRHIQDTERSVWFHSTTIPDTVSYCTTTTTTTTSQPSHTTSQPSHTTSQSSHTTTKLNELGGAGEGQNEVDLEALVKLEIELCRQEGFTIPSKISPSNWQDLLNCPSPSGRKKFLRFLFLNEKKMENKKKVKELKRLQRLEIAKEKDKELEAGKMVYGLNRNTLFITIRKQSMNQFYHQKVIQAMMFGQPLIMDMDYDDYMSRRELQNCAYQLQLLITDNRRHSDPYCLQLFNAHPNKETMRRLTKYIPTIHDPEYPLLINSGSYLDKFPREQLVYLTPHTRDDLITYDHKAAYIIAGLVDKSSGEPLSMAKAKREGIRMQRFPLERYLPWGIGNKCLTLDQSIKIMLDMKISGDWSYAFRHIPRRKLKQEATQQSMEGAVLRRIRKQERNTY